MRFLAVILIVVSVVVADEKGTMAKQEKRQIPSYNGGSGVLQPSQTPQPAPPAASNTVPSSPSYQPNYLPTCVIQPPYNNPIYPSVLPYYVPTDSYVPQYQPSQYPVTYQPPSQYPATYQPSQYPATYQPSQYPATYQPSQYPAAYQPSQYPATYQYPIAYQPQQGSPSPTPYSYSYYSATTSNANNAVNNAPLAVTKK